MDHDIREITRKSLRDNYGMVLQETWLKNGTIRENLLWGNPDATDAELMDACKQFEAYFLEQMFKSMMDTVPKNEEMSGSGSALMDYYTDEMVQQLASDSTEQNSLGLAQMLYEQMKRNHNL